MVEYGNGVGQVAGRAGGGGGGGRSMDVGASFGQFVNDSMHTVSTMPPAALLAAVVVIVLGLIMLRRAF
jgi:hypothetical protein